MIGEYTLTRLCEKYNINGSKLIKKNNNVLEQGQYVEIDKTLRYLTLILKISSHNIEKCPSILYRNVKAIKENVDFLKTKNMGFETSLHVLSTDPFKLKETYEYVIKNYGTEVINRNTSILSVDKDIIKNVESLNLPFNNKKENLTIAVGVEYGATTIEEIQKIIQSPEFKEHPELFTSETLARAKLEEIQKIIQSPEFKEHPEMFTSTTLAHAKLEEIQKIIQSLEFKEHPELFTSQTLAHAKIEEISKLLKLDCWKDERFSKLLTSSIVAKSKSMIEKLPKLIEMAEKYGIDKNLNTSFLLFSPSQNYALIRYLQDSNQPLIIDDKLNSLFGKQPGVLLKKYKIDLKQLMEKYPLDEKKIEKKSGFNDCIKDDKTKILDSKRLNGEIVGTKEEKNNNIGLE